VPACPARLALLQRGGLGLREASLDSHATYWASWFHTAVLRPTRRRGSSSSSLTRRPRPRQQRIITGKCKQPQDYSILIDSSGTSQLMVGSL